MLTPRREVLIRPRRAPPPLLDGVRRADWIGRPAAARRLGAILADRSEVAYCLGAADEAQLGDRRVEALESMRMSSAKLLGAAYRFLCDSSVSAARSRPAAA